MLDTDTLTGLDEAAMLGPVAHWVHFLCMTGACGKPGGGPLCPPGTMKCADCVEISAQPEHVCPGCGMVLSNEGADQ